MTDDDATQPIPIVDKQAAGTIIRHSHAGRPIVFGGAAAGYICAQSRPLPKSYPAMATR